jgi:hypothetical protein
MATQDPRESRDLAYRFLSLPVTRRKQILRTLGVLHEGQNYEETELLAEVRRRGLIDDLHAEVEAR